jgi:hypothetical protein
MEPNLETALAGSDSEAHGMLLHEVVDGGKPTPDVSLSRAQNEALREFPNAQGTGYPIVTRLGYLELRVTSQATATASNPGAASGA